MINYLSETIHRNNKAKGFYDEEKNTGEILCLVHSEVSEALECDRKGRYCNLHSQKWKDEGVSLLEKIDSVGDAEFKEFFEANIKDTFEDELADVMIRVMDLAAYKGIDLDNHILLKVKYNTSRERMHGKQY